MHTAVAPVIRTDSRATRRDNDAAAGGVPTTELLRRAGADDPAAWSELVRRYTPLLRARAASHRLQEADALDAVQVTWLRLAEHAHRIHTPEHLAGWLATTMSRECLRILRHHGRMLTAEGVMAVEPDPGVGPEQAVIDDYVRRVLSDAVGELPPRLQRLVGELFGEERRPYAEIAREVRIPVGSIGPTRARTLNQLRGILERRGL